MPFAVTDQQLDFAGPQRFGSLDEAFGLLEWHHRICIAVNDQLGGRFELR